MRQTVIAFAAGLLIGGGALLALGLENAEASAPEPEIIERTRVVSAPYQGPSLAAIRETVRAEMAAQAGGEAVPVAPPSEESELAADPEREAAAAEAYADATRLLDTALSRGVWDDEDAHALRLWLPRMSASQADEVLDNLITAINAQQVAVTTAGAPF